MRRLALLCMLALPAGPAAAQTAPARPADDLAALRALAEPPRSLFFRADEVEYGNAILEGEKADRQARDVMAGLQSPAAPAPEPEPPDAHLGALVYLGPDRWVLWLNGERRTPRDRGGAMRIVAVGPDRVRIGWTGAGAYQVDLKPYQTYLGAGRTVVEGRRGVGP